MKVKSFKDGLEFDNGTSVVDDHSQDCCENVYADWSQLKDTDIMNHEFPAEIKIEGVEGSGFRIDGYFVPCYNQQNGYYSGNLKLVIKYPDKRTVTIDISNFVEDQID
jgi:hypothetical protein